MDGSITIATTIAPRDIANQQRAIHSWIEHGFHVVSLNDVSEIDVLRPHFPEIEFVKVHRTAKERFGRHYVYFDDFMAYFQSISQEVCGIVNSDIHFVGYENRLAAFMAEEAKETLVFGPRMDVESLDTRRNGVEFGFGFDFFFFPRRLSEIFPATELCLGLPWWDFWILLLPMKHHIPLKKLVTPVAYHIKHEIKWAEEPFEVLGEVIFDHLSKEGYSIDIGGAGKATYCYRIVDGASQPIVIDKLSKLASVLSILVGDGDASQLENTTQSLTNQTVPVVWMHEHDAAAVLEENKASFIYYMPIGTTIPPYFLEYMISYFEEDTDRVVCSVKYEHSFFKHFNNSLSAMAKETVENAERYPLLRGNSLYRTSAKSVTNVRFVGMSMLVISMKQFIQSKYHPYSGKPLYLYGAGGHTEQFVSSGVFEELPLKGIAVKDTTPLPNQVKYGLPIITLDELQRTEESVLMISSFTYEDEIYEELSNTYPDLTILKIYR